MPMKCICLPTNSSNAKNSKKTNTCSQRPAVTVKLDLCEISNRTQDKSNRHDDCGCHNKGEQRQNLINKLKLYLDNIDDRYYIGLLRCVSLQIN